MPLICVTDCTDVKTSTGTRFWLSTFVKTFSVLQQILLLQSAPFKTPVTFFFNPLLIGSIKKYKLRTEVKVYVYIRKGYIRYFFIKATYNV
jgi:hypothetical protein